MDTRGSDHGPTWIMAQWRSHGAWTAPWCVCVRSWPLSTTDRARHHHNELPHHRISARIHPHLPRLHHADRMGLPPISLGFVTLFGYITSTTLLQALQGATSLILLVVASGTLAALVPPGQWVTLLPRSPGTVTTLITVSSALARTLAHHIPNAHLIHRIRPHAPRKQLLVSLTDILLSESVTLAAALSRARHPHTRQQQRKATLLVFLFLTTATMTMTSVLLHSPTLTTVSAFLLTLTTISMWRTAHKGTTALRRQHITWRDATMWSAALIMATGSLSHHTPGIGALSMTLVLTPLVIARKDTHAYLS